jgi:sodium/potassium-transporting ATPase subunit alpha
MLQLSELSPAVPLDGPPVPPLAPWDNYTRGCFLLSVKGAPEVLMPRCTHVLGPGGSVPMPLSPTIREHITDIQENWSRNGQRVLLLARRIVQDDWLTQATDRQSEEFAEVVEEFNRDLIIVGLIGLINPLKPDIKRTVRSVSVPNRVI